MEKLITSEHLSNIKFAADCAIKEPDSIYSQEFFMLLDETFGSKGDYESPTQAVAVAWLINRVNELAQRAEAAEAIVSDVKEVIGLLTEREWAEHCTKTETGKLLEELITELHDDASPDSGLEELVPDEIPGSFVYHGAKGAFDAGKSAGWNACRDEILKNLEERESEKA